MNRLQIADPIYSIIKAFEKYTASVCGVCRDQFVPS